MGLRLSGYAVEATPPAPFPWPGACSFSRRAAELIQVTVRKIPVLQGLQAGGHVGHGLFGSLLAQKGILPGLELLAEYLGQTYRMLQPTHTESNAGGHITVSNLAAFCRCSESYLSRIFKKRTGGNINVYINKVRMELAKNHLLLSRENIAEIAAGVGFNDPNYFSRVFTQIIGIPPTEFRRRFQRDIPYGDDKKDPAPVQKGV